LFSFFVFMLILINRRLDAQLFHESEPSVYPVTFAAPLKLLYCFYSRMYLYSGKKIGGCKGEKAMKFRNVLAVK
jgi:hypothetical protein